MGLTLQQQKSIEMLFKRLHSATAVAKEMGIGADSVKIFLHKKGYELKRGGRRVASNGGRAALSNDEIRKVIMDYRTHHGCSGCASRNSYTDEVFNKYWYLAGLLRIPHKEAHFDPVEVTDRHLERSYKQCLRILDGSIKTPVQIIRIKDEKFEEETKPLGKRIDRRYRGEEIKSRIISSYDRYDGDVRLAAASLPYGMDTIRRYWARFKRDAREAHNLYRGDSTRAARELSYPEKEILRVWRDFGLLSERGTSELEKKLAKDATI